MLVPEVKKEIINQIFIDAFNRVSGVFLMNKPEGVTSHDVVDDMRRILRTKKVGHAGALDPFASGLLIILVGKYTKYTEAFINLDKSYSSEVIIGKSTDSQDIEGKVLEEKKIDEKTKKILLDKNKLEEKLIRAFMPSYDQLVPVFSSVKVQGRKLRQLARSAKEIQMLSKEKVKFILPNEPADIIVQLPRKKVQIKDINVSSVKEKNGFVSITLDVDCSKGTYIRQLAEDIGLLYDLPSFLNALQRTKIDEFLLQDALNIDEVYKLAVDQGILDKSLQELNLRLKRINN
jgi:tRNA pseudouridine55 synthase